MTKFDKKAILSAKDSVKSASDKLTKIAMDMEESGNAPSPEQVKEVVESIAAVAQEIVAEADKVAQGLETIVGDGQDVPPKENEGTPVVTELDEETKAKMAAQDEEITELKKFKETSEKEKMASDYANLFPAAQRSAKFTEFMKMDKPNSELRTVVSATENALTSLTKSASMHKTNETIIFKESTQKNASMGGFGQAKSLTEI